MSTEIVKEVVINRSEGTQLMSTSIGDVCLFNTDLVNPKILSIINFILENGGFENYGHGVLSVVFRNDGYPVSKEVGGRNNWMFYADSQSAVCNILDCIEMAFDVTQNAEIEGTENVSVFYQVWKNIIQGFAHEAHHAEAFIGNEDDIRNNDDAREKEEEKANLYAKQMMFKIGKAINIEPELPSWLITDINGRLTEQLELIAEMHKDLKPEEVDVKLRDWAICQTYMRDEGVAFYRPNEDEKNPAIIYKTFKEFLHQCSGDAEDDKAWNTPTIAAPVDLVQEPVNETAAGGVPTLAPFEPDEEDDSFDDIPDPDQIVTGFAGVQAITPQTDSPFSEVQTNGMSTKNIAIASEIHAPAGAPQPLPPVAPILDGNENPAIVMGAKAYPPIVLPKSVNLQSVVYGLYLKIFTHIFQTCQYNPTDPTTPFAAANNIAAWLPLDQYETMFVKEMTCYSADPAKRGVWCPGTPVEGAISGLLINKEKTLPAYELTLSKPNGTQIKRKFIPQNPNKVKNGALTGTAQLAKQGNQILWIIDPDTKAYNIRVYNGVIQNNVNGKWA
jgi:hypothetical protein